MRTTTQPTDLNDISVGPPSSFSAMNGGSTEGRLETESNLLTRLTRLRPLARFLKVKPMSKTPLYQLLLDGSLINIQSWMGVDTDLCLKRIL